MLNRQGGYSLVELMITMLLFVFVIAAATSVFTGLLTQFKQQSKIAETNIEGAIGLEILRKDLESAGYGLPWNVDGVANWAALTNYSEAASVVPGAGDPPNPANFNDGNAATGTGGSAPRGLVSGNNTGVDFSAVAGSGSDYLVIKAANVARNDASQRWTHLRINNIAKEWSPASEMLSNGDRVVVLSPGSTDASRQALIVSGGSYFTTYDTSTAPDSLANAGFAPTDSSQTHFVYGIDPTDATSLRMPFNRADYFIKRPGTTPSQCANNTGVLYKATVNHNGGGINELPILDCVADIQVVFRRDTDDDGTIDNTTDDISALTAEDIRNQVKEVRVYILAHEGQRDLNYTHTPTTIYVGDAGIGSGRNFDIGTNVNYRWKVYTIVVKPKNLR